MPTPALSGGISPMLVAHRRLLLSLVVAVSAAGSAYAVEPKSGKAPPEGVDYFVGAWTASSTDPATDETIVVDYRVTTAAGGAWITGDASAPKAGIASRDMWGRDPRTGEIMRVIFDGSGTFAVVKSPGWKGDTLMLEGEAQSKGGVVRVRETIRRLGRTEFQATWEALRDGRWSVYAVERVTRRRTRAASPAGEFS